jgi:hypothetical protein
MGIQTLCAAQKFRLKFREVVPFFKQYEPWTHKFRLKFMVTNNIRQKIQCTIQFYAESLFLVILSCLISQIKIQSSTQFEARPIALPPGPGHEQN